MNHPKKPEKVFVLPFENGREKNARKWKETRAVAGAGKRERGEKVLEKGNVRKESQRKGKFC